MYLIGDVGFIIDNYTTPLCVCAIIWLKIQAIVSCLKTPAPNFSIALHPKETTNLSPNFLLDSHTLLARIVASSEIERPASSGKVGKMCTEM